MPEWSVTSEVQWGQTNVKKKKKKWAALLHRRKLFEDLGVAYQHCSILQLVRHNLIPRALRFVILFSNSCILNF